MGSEAAVIRSKMNQTRAELDYKISQLQRKRDQMTPRAVANRYMPEHALDYALGGVLTLLGAKMAWGGFRSRRSRAEHIRTAVMECRSW